MDYTKLFATLVQLGIFSVFITSIIEVVKGISAIGLWGLIKGIWATLTNNSKLDAAAFPVLNFAIALFCCWAFDVGIMKMFAGSLSGNAIVPLSNYIDYFGTASVTYLGSDQLFKKFLDAKKAADAAVAEAKQ